MNQNPVSAVIEARSIFRSKLTIKASGGGKILSGRRLGIESYGEVGVISTQSFLLQKPKRPYCLSKARPFQLLVIQWRWRRSMVTLFKIFAIHPSTYLASFEYP